MADSDVKVGLRAHGLTNTSKLSWHSHSRNWEFIDQEGAQLKDDPWVRKSRVELKERV